MSASTDPIEILIEPAWLQQPGETTQWYERFQRYYQAGGDRSIRSIYIRWRREQDSVRAELSGEPTRPLSATLTVPGSWQKATKRYRWVERADAWDRHQFVVNQKLWDERQNQFRAQAWETYESLMGRSKEMMRLPIVEQEVVRQAADGQPMVVQIKPAKWNYSDMLRTMQMAHEAAALAVGDVNAAITLLENIGFTVNKEKAIVEPDGEEMLDLDDLLT